MAALLLSPSTIIWRTSRGTSPFSMGIHGFGIDASTERLM
jgi:hypothetical protein